MSTNEVTSKHFNRCLNIKKESLPGILMLNAGVLLKMSRNTASFAYGFPQSAFKLKHYQLNSTQSIEYLRNTIAMGKATVNMQPKRHLLCGEA